MKENVNTQSYWDKRFSSGDWIKKRGRQQTRNFAKSISKMIPLSKEFEGTILDFGCGLGDAIPIFKKRYPQASIIGLDISQSAIDACISRYGSLAQFLRGGPEDAPVVDVIIASNVLEHLSFDLEVVQKLLKRCKYLFIAVPYMEEPLIDEHVNFYDEDYYLSLGKYEFCVFPCRGWSEYGPRGLWYQIYFKNIFRRLLGKPLKRRKMQILFCFSAQT